MKKIAFLLCLMGVGFFAKAQTNPFPTVDSLERFINRYIRNSPVESFQNLRANTAMIGLARFLRSSGVGTGIDTVYTLNDSTLRIRTNEPQNFDVILPGGGSTNLDSLRTSTQIKIVNGTDTTIFQSATPTLAGAMPAADKVKVNRLEPYLNHVALRANTNIDTGVIYVDSKGGAFRYDPNDVTTLDDTVMTIVATGGARLKRVTKEGVVYAEWFGAIPDDGIRDDQCIQRAINFVIAKNDSFSTVKFKSGRYEIHAPMIMYRWDGTNYQFFTCKLEGEEAFWNSSGNGTRFIYNQKNGFVVGIQRGKGCEVSKIRIDGNFTPPSNANYLTWYDIDFEDFVDPTVIDSTHAPYAGIVIDPFKQDAILPLGGHYPGLETYYRGTGPTGGSTGTILSDLQIRGFAVCIMNSANGTTLNGELTLIDRVNLAACRVGIAGGNDQEKLNRITNVAAWENIHTLFATNLYGAQTPGNWYIDGVNVAGNINRLVYLSHGNYFPTFIKNVFAESIGSVGYIDGSMQTSFESCIFDFASYVDSSWNYPKGYNIRSVGSVVFKNSSFRYYGQTIPITIYGNPVFENCRFDDPPFVANDANSNSAQFINCKITGGYMGLRGEHVMQKNQVGFTTMYGDFTLRVDGQSNFEERNIVKNSNHRVRITDFLSGTQALVISPKRVVKVGLSAAYRPYWKTGNIAYVIDGSSVTKVLGWIKYVSADTAVVVGVPEDVTSGSYYVGTSVPLRLIGAFGNMTSGSNVLSNYVLDFPLATQIDSQLVYTEYFRGPNLEPYAMIVSHTGSDITFNRNSLATQTGVFIGGYRKDFERIDGGNQITAINRLLKEGGYIYTKDNSAERRPIRHFVTKSGYSVPSGGETRQGEWRTDQSWSTYNYQRITASTYTLLPMDEYVDAHAGSNNITITLPTMANVMQGSSKATKVLRVQKIDSSANTVTIQAGASSTINGASTYVLSDTGESVTLHLDFTASMWRVDQSTVTGSFGADTTEVEMPLYVVNGTKDTLKLRYGYGLMLQASDSALIPDTSLLATQYDLSLISGGSGTPGGSDTHVQFNDGGSFGGESTFIYNKTNNSVYADSVRTLRIQAPTILGGTATTSSITYQTTAGVGASGADHIWKGGNAGATEFLRILNDGKIGIQTSAPTHALTLQATPALDGIALYKTTDQVTNYGRGIIKMSTSGTNPQLQLNVQAGGTLSPAGITMQVGGTDIWAIDATGGTLAGNLFFSGDNARDIGRVSASPFRPRSIYVGTNVQIGLAANTTTTAKLHIGAGTTSASSAPIKLTSGSLMSSAEVGALEFLTDKYYATITTSAARKEFALNDIALTSGRVVLTTTNGRLTDLAPGTDGHVLTLSSGAPVWSAPTGATSDSKVLPDADYTIVSTDGVLILPDPAATRTLTLPAASTMQNKEITIFCKASSVGEWILSGSFVQNALNLTEDFTNSGLGSNQVLRLRSCNNGGTWRWYDIYAP